MTVDAVSRRAGLDPGYWRKVERSDVDPGLKNLLRIQYALDLDSLEPLLAISSGGRLRTMSEEDAPGLQVAS